MISDAMLVLCPILNKMMLMMSVKIWLKKKNSLKNISLTTTFIPSFVKRSLLYVGSQTRITSQTSHFFNSYNKKYKDYYRGYLWIFSFNKIAFAIDEANSSHCWTARCSKRKKTSQARLHPDVTYNWNITYNSPMNLV